MLINSIDQIEYNINLIWFYFPGERLSVVFLFTEQITVYTPNEWNTERSQGGNNQNALGILLFLSFIAQVCHGDKFLVMNINYYVNFILHFLLWET